MYSGRWARLSLVENHWHSSIRKCQIVLNDKSKIDKTHITKNSKDIVVLKYKMRTSMDIGSKATQRKQQNKTKPENRGMLGIEIWSRN